MSPRISFLSNLKYWHALAGAALTIPLVHLTTRCQSDVTSEVPFVDQRSQEDSKRLYAAYNSKGKLVPLRHIVESMKDYEVILMGEYHDDPVAHLVELHILSEAQRVYSREGSEGRHVMLSLEMLERDVQCVVNEWLDGHITDRDLQKDARVWPNWTSDYLPLAELARKHSIPVICPNAPRRYVSIAGRWGRESLEMLPASSRQWLPPLPYSLPSAAYTQKTDQMMQLQAQAGTAGDPCSRDVQVVESSKGETADKHTAQQEVSSSSSSTSNRKGDMSEGVGEPQEKVVCPHIGLSRDSNFLAAQSLWDASMAHSLAEGLKCPGEPLIIHVCGKAHIEGWMGIPEHLKHYKQDVKALVITMIPASVALPISDSEFAEQHLWQYGDFVILTDESQTRSFDVEHPV